MSIKTFLCRPTRATIRCTLPQAFEIFRSEQYFALGVKCAFPKRWPFKGSLSYLVYVSPIGSAMYLRPAGVQVHGTTLIMLLKETDGTAVWFLMIDFAARKIKPRWEAC